MILVTRLNGSPFAVNPDLLERVEPTPDTVLTLIDGTKYIVTESVTEIITLVREFRASVVVAARAVPREGLDEAPEEAPAAVAPRAHLQVAPAPVAEGDEVLDPSDTVEMDELDNLEHAETSVDGARRPHAPVLAAVPAPVEISDVAPSDDAGPAKVGG